MIKYFSLKKYIVRILLLNIFGLAFLSDTISFDQGIFSLQGFVYSLNKFFYLVFILLETVSVYLQEYNLSFDFIRIILADFFSLNFRYNFFILIEKYRYLLFFFFFIFYIFYFEKKIIKKQINFKFNLNFFIISGILVFIIILLQNDRLELYLKKIKNYKEITLKYNFLRNDNWFLQTINYFDYEKKGNNLIFDKIEFNKIIDNKYDNIFVIINESYPLFKNDKINNLMQKNLINKNLKVEKFKKNWNKKYSTQGSEIEFFCNTDKDFDRFKNDFDNLIREKCWINELRSKNTVFIHTYKKSFFNRDRYDHFFSNTFFLEDLKKLNFQICPGMYEGICDYEILINFKKFLKKENNFLVFLTLQNHHPLKLYPSIERDEIATCKNFYPLNIKDQFCYLYLNQSYFNKLIQENVIEIMGKNDLLLILSDTPPAFTKKWKIFFEDYVEIIKITK